MTARTPTALSCREAFVELVQAGIRPTVYGKVYNSIFVDALNRFYRQIAFGEISLEDGAASLVEEAQGMLG